MLFIVVFSVGQVSATETEKEWHRLHNGNRHNQSEYLLQKLNIHLFRFIPEDTTGKDETSTLCNEHGSAVDDNYTTSRCFIYHSKQTGTAWKIRYTQPNGDATQVFKIQNGKMKLWASFNERHENIYASTDAQRYASAHSNGDTGVARNQDRENPAQEASKINQEDLIKKGLGTILPGIFR